MARFTQCLGLGNARLSFSLFLALLARKEALVSVHSSKTEPRRLPSGRKEAKPHPSPSTPRIRRNPSHLEELEAAAQTEVSEIAAELDAEPAEAPARPPAPEDADRQSVVEAGLSVDPEDLGRQFLSDATDQGNFESDVSLEREEAPLVDVTGEVMVAARDAALDVSEKSTPRVEAERLDVEEEALPELDLHASSIREGSLFDQPTEQGTRSPRIEADADAEDEPRGARETAEAQALARLKRLTRPRALRRSHVAHSRR
jgi:hypothetical protein